MARFGWQKICLAHFVDEYATNIINVLLTEGNREGRTLDVLSRLTFRNGATNFTDGLLAMRAADCRVVVAVVDNFDLIREAIARNMFGRSGGIQWIFPEILLPQLVPQVISQAGLNPDDFLGVFLTQPLAAPEGSAIYARFADAIRNRTGGPPGAYSTFLYDAILTAARACGSLVRGGNELNAITSRRVLIEAIQSQSFTGVSGKIAFDENHDRKGASYGLYNFRPTSGGLANVGVWEEQEGLDLSSTPIFFDGTANVPSDRKIVPLISIFFGSPGAVAVGTITAAALIIVCVATSVVLYLRRDHKVIVRSSPVFLAIIIVGLALALISIFFWFGSPTIASCHLRLWFGVVGSGVAYASVLAKNWRLFYLFNEPTLRIVAISNLQVLGATALMVGPLAAILVLWSSLAPFQIIAKLNAVGSLQYLTCVSSYDRIFAPITFAYMGFLFVVGAILSFKTRVLPYATSTPSSCRSY